MPAVRHVACAVLAAFGLLGLQASPARAQSEEPAAAPRAELALEPSPGTPEPPALPPPSARWNLLLTGLAVTGVSYGAALGASYLWPDARTSNELRIPVVGPWMAIADTGCEPEEPDCSTVLLVFTAILTGMDGVLQAGGLGIALESVFMPTSSAAPAKRATPTLRPVPYVAGTDALGLGVVGTF